VFDVTVDGTLVFSRHELGRHMHDEREVLDLIRELKSS
jgi:hypothetical protein